MRRFSVVIDVDAKDEPTIEAVQSMLEECLLSLPSSWDFKVWPVTEREADA